MPTVTVVAAGESATADYTIATASVTPWLPVDASFTGGNPAYAVSVGSMSPDADPGEAYVLAHFLPPGDSSSAAYGGPMRDYFRKSSPQITDRVTALVEEQGWLKASGVDADACDYFSASTTDANRWSEFTNRVKAAAQVGSKVIPEPDGTTSNTASAAQLAADLLSVAKGPNGSALARTPDGRMLIVPFAPERVPANGSSNQHAFWSSFTSAMVAGGEKPPAIIGCYLDLTVAPTYQDIFYGHARWGDAIPSAVLSNTNLNVGASAWVRANCPASPRYFQYVRPQDVRPRQNNLASESQGWDLLLACWANAKTADGALLITWNDFYEGAYWSPTRDNGFALTDAMSTMLALYKQPGLPIVRDGFFLAHRKQSAAYHGTQSTAPTWSGTPVDQVAALVFLTAPATVTITSGGVATPQNCPAGMSQVKAPLRQGAVSCAITRNGQSVASKTSPLQVADSGVSDKAYRFVSSYR